MATKAEERKALDKIRDILTELGPGYVWTAFEGVMEDARENIESDFALSMKDRWKSAEEKYNDAKVDLDCMKADLDDAKAEINRLSESVKLEREYGNKKREELEEAVKEAVNWMDKYHGEKEKLSAAEAEIVSLKARLWDELVESGKIS